jgi:hypothetical protein
MSFLLWVSITSSFDDTLYICLLLKFDYSPPIACDYTPPKYLLVSMILQNCDGLLILCNELCSHIFLHHWRNHHHQLDYNLHLLPQHKLQNLKRMCSTFNGFDELPIKGELDIKLYTYQTKVAITLMFFLNWHYTIFSSTMLNLSHVLHRLVNYFLMTTFKVMNLIVHMIVL